MWDELIEDLDLDTKDGLDLKASFFVGDAGGRLAMGAAKADHSCSDRDFATNVGINFITPEELFLHEEPRAYNRTFEPRAYLDKVTDREQPVITRSNPLDIVIFCGSPGAGKSTFYWSVLQPLRYERVNQDQLKSVCVSPSFSCYTKQSYHAPYLAGQSSRVQYLYLRLERLLSHIHDTNHGKYLTFSLIRLHSPRGINP